MQTPLQTGGPRPLQRLRRVSRNGRQRPRDSAFHRRPLCTNGHQHHILAARAHRSRARRHAACPASGCARSGSCARASRQTWTATCARAAVGAKPKLRGAAGCCRMMKSPCGGSCGPGHGYGSATGSGCLTCCGCGCGSGRPPCHCARRPARRPPRERPPLVLLPSRAPPPGSQLRQVRQRPPLLLGLLLLEPLTCLRARAPRLPPAVSLVYCGTYQNQAWTCAALCLPAASGLLPVSRGLLAGRVRPQVALRGQLRLSLCTFCACRGYLQANCS